MSIKMSAISIPTILYVTGIKWSLICSNYVDIWFTTLHNQTFFSCPCYCIIIIQGHYLQWASRCQHPYNAYNVTSINLLPSGSSRIPRYVNGGKLLNQVRGCLTNTELNLGTALQIVYRTSDIRLKRSSSKLPGCFKRFAEIEQNMMKADSKLSGSRFWYTYWKIWTRR